MAELHRLMTDLSPEIQLFHILSRLPAKSVLRFMCVSKEWHSFIKSSLFMKMHLRNVTKRDFENHQKLVVLSMLSRPMEFSTFDCEAPEDGLPVGRSLPFKLPIGNEVRIITSIHGLVCLGIQKDMCDEYYSDLILWNPSTEEYKTLSKDNSHVQCYNWRGGAFELYYSSSDHDYKLLRTVDRDVHIYSLKSDSWRKVETECMEKLKRLPSCSSSFFKPKLDTILLNDKLYFLERVGLDCWIIRFDVKTEKFTEIAKPSFLDSHMSSCLSADFKLNLAVLKGHIHLCVICVVGQDLILTELWRMDGDRDWILVESCYFTVPVISGGCCLEPLHLMRNGNWLVKSLTGSSEGDCVYELDPKTLVSKFVCSYDVSHMRINSEVKFIETFVSPNQYIEFL